VHGGHGAHATGRYRHVDVGREPEATEAHQHQEEHQHQTGETAAEIAAAGYTCPMHPQVASETPGTCPHCGMALVPRKGEE
jgi:hypothetical protein